jgi:hypothetical protein
MIFENIILSNSNLYQDQSIDSGRIRFPGVKVVTAEVNETINLQMNLF